MVDLTHTIEARSDQLNADDLMAGPRVLTITEVALADSPDQPVSVRYDGDGGKPYKPCKSMRRVLIAIWGANGRDWAGQSIEVFRDPEVRFGGMAVGGIRISRATGITGDKKLMLTVTRSKRAPYIIKPLLIEAQTYPQGDFEAVLPKVAQAVQSGKLTHEQAAARLERTAPLTDEQRAAVMAIAMPEPEQADQASEPDFEEEVY